VCGVVLQRFVKIEKLIAEITEIAVERLVVVACKNVFPNRQYIHIVENETAKQASFGVGYQCVMFIYYYSNRY
jgi:hypothetical protein